MVDAEVGGADVALGSSEEVLSAGVASTGISDVEESEERVGMLESDKIYWKPWQPPDSTWIRRARLGLESLVMISRSRFAARGVISNVISFPSSSLVALTMALVAWLLLVLLKFRRALTSPRTLQRASY